jgi:CheY-like chemotaxis protein
MEAIGQLAGGIAHDFNNMLGAISGYAEMIKRKFAEDNPILKKYITRVLDAAVRSADLTSKLLAFARKGRYEIVTVNIHETIQEVINLLEHIIHGRIKTNMHFNAAPASVMGDTSQLQNAILNIAVNSIDAMPEGGALTFVTDIVSLDEEFIDTRPYKIIPGKYLRISIADTGSGMDEEIRSRVFEPFFTTKELGKGTGLGLASTYGIIKNHEGYIEVESKKGKGTEFTIYLPSVDKPSKKTKTVSEKPQKGKGTILVIDDEELIRDIIKDILGELGYTTFTCVDGRQGIEYYKEHHKEIDLVIIDIVLPKINGYDCFVELKKINPHIKAIVSSGQATSDEVEKMIMEGALGFIQKPFEINYLSKMINEALGN